MIKNQKFIIFGHARSGTSTLKQIFESQNINISGEPFNKNCSDNFLSHYEELGFEKTVQKIMGKHDALKHLMHQQNEVNNLYLIEKYKTIFIYRKNIFEAAISSRLAIKTNVWDASDVNYNKNYHKINNINVDDIKETMQEFYDSVMFYKNKVKRVFFVSYEDLYLNEKNKIDIIKNIFDFVGYKIKNFDTIKILLSPNKKLNENNWYNLLSNWKDIESLNKFYLN